MAPYGVPTPVPATAPTPQGPWGVQPVAPAVSSAPTNSAGSQATTQKPAETPKSSPKAVSTSGSSKTTSGASKGLDIELTDLKDAQDTIDKALGKTTPKAATSEPQDSEHGYFCGVKCFSTRFDVPRRMTAVEKFIMLAQCIFAVVTAIMSILSYTKWDVSGDMLQDFRTNMKQYPVLDIRPSTSISSCGDPSYKVWRMASQFRWTEETTENGEKKKVTRRFPVEKWRERAFCVQFATDMGNALDRVRPDLDGLCPSGYDKCGPYDCSPTSVGCPVTKMEIKQGDACKDIDSNHMWSHESVTYCLDLTYGVENGSDRPLIDVAINSMNGICRGDGSHFNSVMKRSCTVGTDNRYTSIDNYDLWVLLDELNAPNSALDAAEDDTAYLLTRSEIAWLDATCAYSRQQAVEHVPTLIDIAEAQKIMMIIIIIAVVINLFFSYRVYKDRTDWDASNDNQAAWPHFVIGTVLDSVILGITIYALVKSESERTFLTSISESQTSCTDYDTRWVFDHFVSASDSVSSYNIAVLSLRGAWVLYRVFKGLKYKEGAV